MDGTTRAIIKQIESLGYHVHVERKKGAVMMRAEGKEPHEARCNDGDGEEETYRAACLLAQAVGIDLEDG